MKRKLLRFGKGFRVALQNRRSQAAEMTIAPGGAEGGAGNRHSGADQWLFVMAGRHQGRQMLEAPHHVRIKQLAAAVT